MPDAVQVHPDAVKAQVAAGPNEIWAELCGNTRIMIRRLDEHKEVIRAGIGEAKETNQLMREVLEMHTMMHSELIKMGRALVVATQRMEKTLAEQNKVLQFFQEGENEIESPADVWRSNSSLDPAESRSSKDHLIPPRGSGTDRS